MQRLQWDVFCHAVDNYGDVGICWRIARQLAHEFDQTPRLWIDAPAVLSKLVPQYVPDGSAQVIENVEIRVWTDPFPGATPGDVALETFGCGLPPAYAGRMAAAIRPPLWINLEHLSAEAWIDGCHGLTSRQPRLPLTCHFFFPGFSRAVGGLLRERDLLARRDAFDAAARERWWQTRGFRIPERADLTVMLFSYEHPAVAELLEAWATESRRIVCLIPESPALTAAERFFGGAWRSHGAQSGSLEVHALPFVPQSAFDELLWACDLNFVRGEDSFLRAQWAARPFVWQAYPQADGAHWNKIQAFLERYSIGLEAATRDALNDFWAAWNRGTGVGAAWPPLSGRLAQVDEQATRWASRLAAGPELVSELVSFARERLK